MPTKSSTHASADPIVTGTFVHPSFRAAAVLDAWCWEGWRGVHEPFPVRLSIRLARRGPMGDSFRAFVKNRRTRSGVRYFTSYHAARAAQIQAARVQLRNAKAYVRQLEKVLRSALALPRKATT